MNQHGMSTVDYFLSEYNNFVIIKGFDIMPVNEFADHCVLSIYKERNPSPIIFSANPPPELYLAWEATSTDLSTQILLTLASEKYTVYFDI